MELRVLVADDEAFCREHLRLMLEEERDLEVVAECANGREALESIRRLRPEVVLLDIRMPELDGLRLMREIPPTERPVVIFVTACERSALEAFEIDAADYLLKPFDRSRLHAALERARARARKSSKSSNPPPADEEAPESADPFLSRLAIKEGRRISFVPIETIDCIVASDNYAEVRVGGEAHFLRATLNDLERRLPPDLFTRISRSTMVNLNRIKEIRSQTHGDYLVLMTNGAQLRATRLYRQNLMLVLAQHQS